MKALGFAVLALATISLAVPQASAQPVAPAKSGMVDYVEGTVYVNEELVTDPIVATFPYIKENGRLRTEEGRAEALMQGGVALRLGENSTLKMISSRFVDTRIELERGSAVVQVLELLSGNKVTVILKDASITLAKAGDYRFDAEPARIKVFAGQADVQIGDRTVEVGGGKLLDLSNATASVEKFDKEQTDMLDRWSMRRGQAQAQASYSAAREIYLDSDGSNPCRNSSFGNSVSPSSNPCGTWRWSPNFGMLVYIPYGGRICDPYWGYCLYSPAQIMSIYNVPPPVMPGGGGGYGAYRPSAPTSSGMSGASAASSSMTSAPSSGSGSTAAAASSSSSAGGGSSSGGHGR